jgi:hypothetical protein
MKKSRRRYSTQVQTYRKKYVKEERKRKDNIQYTSTEIQKARKADRNEKIQYTSTDIQKDKKKGRHK